MAYHDQAVGDTVQEPRYLQIYRHLLGQISSGAIKLGEQVPSEKEICRQFCVSRITGKKALEMLAAGGYIERQRGRGSFVVETPASAEMRKKAASFRAIGFILSTLDNFFGKRLLFSVQAACDALGYHMVLRLTHELPAEEEKALRSLDNENICGILMIPTQREHYNTEILNQVLKKRPLVFVDRKMWGLPVPSVTTDNVAAAEMAVQTLLEKGHRNIAFYSGPMAHASTLKDRHSGFTKAFAGTGFSLAGNHLCDTLHTDDDLQIILRHLQGNPQITAALATEFTIAMIIKKALAILGRRLSGELANSGNGDFVLVTFDCPEHGGEFAGFNCLRQNEEDMGRQAMEILHTIIEGSYDGTVMDTLIPAKLVACK